MDTPDLQKLEEGIVTENSVVDDLVSDNVLNLQDTFIRNSFLAISETKLLNNQYLHDKIAINIKRKKPSKYQEVFESTENKNQDKNEILELSTSTNLVPLVSTIISENNNDKDENKPFNLCTLTDTLQTSVREETVDFEDSIVCQFDVSKESAGNLLNEQINLLDDNFSAIPKTITLSNKYLHDKIASNIKRRRPLQGIQGKLASSENESHYEADFSLPTMVLAPVISINISDSNLSEVKESLTNTSIKTNLESSIFSLPNTEVDTSFVNFSSEKFDFEQINVEEHHLGSQINSHENLSNAHDKLSKSNSFITERSLPTRDLEKNLNDKDADVLGLSMHAISMPNLRESLEIHDNVKSPKHGFFKVFKKNKKAQKLSMSTDQLSTDPLQNSNVRLSSVDIDINGSPKINEIENDVNNEVAVYWDVQQVGLFLTEIGLSQYVSNFQSHNVNGRVFLSTKESYLKELGVINKEHRHQILKKIKELRVTSARYSVDKAKDKAKEKTGKIWFWKR
nr:uncharacterized protein LOC101241521 isoform X1 [Hydra vulgaris]XP_047137991.1 uncharacterized protein LOC101241521 isoform X1 [Hydra vulgaris]XP_047137992.1 uncharacterized protein LOC101241521 isoform X1 [Hydra vulgaris]